MKNGLAILMLLGAGAMLCETGRALLPSQAPADTAPPASPAPQDNNPLLDAFEKATAIRYQSDQNGDYWQSPAETKALGRGDCEDKALYLQHLLRQAGVETQVTFGLEHRKNSRQMHAWVECKLQGSLYILDPTNGFIARRRNMPPNQHMPVLGMPSIAYKLRQYIKRTGQDQVNPQYEYILAHRDDLRQ
jgi:hypothetical protein